MKFLRTTTFRNILLVPVFSVMILVVLFRFGAVVNPLAYNLLIADMQHRTEVDLEWLLIEEPSITVGHCSLHDGDFLYYDVTRNDWVTSQDCHPAHVEKGGESFVSLSSDSLYRFDFMEAQHFDPSLSSMTLAPYCTAVIGISENASSGVQLHYGCETEIGVMEFAAFEVKFIPAFAGFIE